MWLKYYNRRQCFNFKKHKRLFIVVFPIKYINVITYVMHIYFWLLPIFGYVSCMLTRRCKINEFWLIIIKKRESWYEWNHWYHSYGRHPSLVNFYELRNAVSIDDLTLNKTCNWASFVAIFPPTPLWNVDFNATIKW